MQLFNGLTIDEVIERQSILFERLYVATETYSLLYNCYVNCIRKKERDGGEIVVGWRRDRATNVDGPEIMWMLTHHAVWKPEGGQAIDITPQRKLINGKMEIERPNYVDFMPDTSATFVDLENPRSPVHIPSAPDAFGYLKEACNLMDKRHALARAADLEQTTKYNAEIGRVGDEVGRLVNAHMKRLQQEINQQKH